MVVPEARARKQQTFFVVGGDTLLLIYDREFSGYRSRALVLQTFALYSLKPWDAMDGFLLCVARGAQVLF